MPAERTLVLKMVADVGKATQGIDKVNAKLSGFGKALAGGLAIAGIGVGVEALASFAGSALDMASSVSESVSKVNTILGESGKKVQAFADTSAKAYGISKKTALEYGGSLAALFTALGQSKDQAADSSTEFLGLAADLASFNNTSVDDALTALQAGLRGESEPLRKFGVLLDDATLKQRAVRLGLIKTTKEALTPQNKALAAQAEILAQTSVAQGDFARTSDGLANSQKVAQASMDDLTAQIGQVLLPLATQLVQLFVTNVLPILTQVGTAFGQLAAVVGPLLGPILAQVTALFQQLWAIIGPSLLPLVKALQAAFGQLWAVIGPAIGPVLGAVFRIFGGVAKVVGTLLGVVLQVATIALPPLIALLTTLLKVILPPLTFALNKVADVYEAVADAIAKVVGWVKDAIAWIGRLIDLLPDIKFPDIHLPDLPFLNAQGTFALVPSARGLGASRAAPAGGLAGATINVYTTGDSLEAEQAIVRALTRHGRLNAGLATPVRWTTGTG